MEVRPGLRDWGTNAMLDELDEAISDDERIWMAVDAWERPSEMMPGVAWVIAVTLLLETSAESVREALEHYSVTGVSLAEIHELSIGTEDDWLSELVRRDRLLAWKVGIYAHLVDHKLTAAYYRDSKHAAWARRVQREVDRWKNFDALPEDVGAIVVDRMSRFGGEAEALQALGRLSPPMLEKLERLRGMGGRQWPAWAVPLAKSDAVLGIKVALESMIRRAAQRAASGHAPWSDVRPSREVSN